MIRYFCDSCRREYTHLTLYELDVVFPHKQDVVPHCNLEESITEINPRIVHLCRDCALAFAIIFREFLANKKEDHPQAK